MPLPEIPGHSQASLGQSLVESLLLSPGSWCIQGFACALQESVLPVLCKFCNQIPLAAKVSSLLFGLRPNYGGGHEDNGDLLQKVPSGTAPLSASDPAAGHC